MRSRNRVRGDSFRKSCVAIITISLLAAGAAPFAGRALGSGGEGAPVVSGFTVTQLSPGNWRLSGTVSSSEGMSGMQLTFEGNLLNETSEPEEDGSFSLDVGIDPDAGDWIDVFATDRWGMDSEIVTHYF